MKILISAYGCEPGKGSDPGVGWNWAKQIARFHEVWVITRANNKDVIEAALAKNPQPSLHFVYVDLPKWMRFWKRGEMGIRIYYFIWQILAYFKGKKLHKRIHFDIVHHLTFPVDWLPAFISFVPAPFVWGPVGGSLKTLPIKFFREFGLKNSLFEILRFLFMQFSLKVDPLLKITRKKAKIILVSTVWDKKNFPQKYQGKIRVISRIGITKGEVENLSSLNFKKKENNKFIVFTTGRLVHWKGHTLSLKAFYEFQKKYPNTVFYIGGKGPELKKLKKLTKKMGLKDKVKFLGHLPTREDVLKKMAECDVFILPTLRDGPLVTFLEVMSLGKPIICANIPGQRDIVIEGCGMKVEAGSPEQMVKDIAHALLKLAQNENLRIEMGKLAKEHVKKIFDWNLKGGFIKKIYEEIKEGKID